jgi:hypothetical protein
VDEDAGLLRCVVVAHSRSLKVARGGDKRCDAARPARERRHRFGTLLFIDRKAIPSIDAPQSAAPCRSGDHARMKKMLRSCASLFLILAAVAGCSNGKDAKLLATPQVGDVYASELSHFAEFDREGHAFGLMKVVGVTDGSVTLVTDSSAWAARSSAENDLRGDLSGVKWDEENTVRIARAELPALYEEDRIFGVLRPEAPKPAQ